MCEQKAVLFDVCSDGTLFQLRWGLIKKEISDNKTWDGEGVETFFKMQSFVKGKGENLPVGVDHKHTPSSEQSCLVSCVCLWQEKTCRGPGAAPSRWWDTQRCARSWGRPVTSVPRPHPHQHLSFRPHSRCAGSRVSSLLLGDDSFTDNWKLEFWKRSIYLKENRFYLLPPVKYSETCLLTICIV